MTAVAKHQLFAGNKAAKVANKLHFSAICSASAVGRVGGVGEISGVSEVGGVVESVKWVE